MTRPASAGSITLLLKLTALKRQQAERQVAALLRELDRINKSIRAVENRLQGLEDATLSFDVLKGTHESGFVSCEVQRLQALRRERVSLDESWRAARRGLSEVMHSEERLQSMAAASPSRSDKSF